MYYYKFILLQNKKSDLKLYKSVALDFNNIYENMAT